MYWNDGESENLYPRCTSYMKSFLNPKTLQKNKKVYNAFIKACGNNKKIAHDALTWGNKPQVNVNQGLLKLRKTEMCGANPPTIFSKNSPTVIISSIRIVPLEKCVGGTDMVNNKRRFESTLLHEIVHVVRMIAGETDLDWDFPDKEEPGEQFEIWAYGKRTCDLDEIADATSSIF